MFGKSKKCIYEGMLILLGCLLLSFFQEISVYAATGEVTFGSENYRWDEHTVNPIGIYVTGDETIARYDITVTFDEEKLRYVRGGTEQSGNKVYIRGTGNETNYKTMLYFETLVPGSTQIQITAATCVTVAEPTVVSGNDALETAPENFTMTLNVVPITIRQITSCKLSELTIEPVNLEGFDPEVIEYTMEVPAEVDDLKISYVPEEQGAEVTISDTLLKYGENKITVSVKGTNATTNYIVHVKRLEAEPTPGPTVEPSPEPTVEPFEEPTGTPTTEPTAIPIVESESREKFKLNPETVFLVVGCLLVFILTAWYLVDYIKRRIDEDRRCNQTDADIIDLEKVVVSVRNVTMQFKVSKEEISSLKEYLITVTKGKGESVYIKALDNISFDVKQGDVIGIIGTNGSGKSTLLKIISGVLKPSKGHVKVDRSKVQMLTLGTGFDMELTARENVYLNGAIIGYDKEYLDEKFDDIVKFAELEGFMDERMKNFSSGMVSRLGFAIATMRDAPDILILDEVLSVGDMFFRQKSQERIKEMIHSGATVFIVSHSMETIKKNCNKVIWIEKGVLQMIGDAEAVCSAYSMSDVNN